MSGKIRNHLCGECSGDQQARELFRQEDCVSYQINNDDGELKVTEYHVFPGIWLIYKDAHTRKYIYPKAYPSGLLEITHCREGRFEYNAGDSFFYLSKGDMAIHKTIGGNAAVNCPTKHYHGVSVVIDHTVAPNCLSCLLDDVNVQPTGLLQKFCRKEQYFIMRSTDRLEHIFSELYTVPEEIQKGYFKVKILELLLFLSTLDPGLSQTEQRSCSKAQVALAKQVCEYINTHMEVRLTIEQLAARFYISPTQLKKCFYSVYGESVQAYIRSYKMQSAAHCLETTNRPISEIACSLGYDNNSKFSRAFRNVMGASPTEYRKRVFLEH